MPPTSTSISNSSNKHPTAASTLPVHLLVSAALETWCHQLLYVRRVYPKETFCNTYFLNIRCKANRHPDVVSYIQNAIEVAVPALMGGGPINNSATANSISLEVVDQNKVIANIEKEAQEEEELSSKKRKLETYSFLQQEEQEQHHQSSSQQSMSSISTTAVQLHQQSQNSTEASEDAKTTPQQQSSSRHQQQQKSSLLQPRSFQVVEKFTLSFLSNSLEQDQKEPPSRETIYDKSETAEIGNSSRNNKPKVPNLFAKKGLAKESRPSQKEAPHHPKPDSKNDDSILLRELEQGFRNLILNLNSLKRNRVPASDGLSFKIVLHIMGDTNGQQSTACTDEAVPKALETGSWYPCSAETTAAVAERWSAAPLYQISVQDCDIRFIMQRQPSNNK